MSERREDIGHGLQTVRRRIAEAAARTGRETDEITLIVVTKYFPASDVRILADLGVREVGENKHQEAAQKADELADLRADGLRWHFVGGLQSNKAAAVARYADAVHSVDRTKLVDRLSRGALERAGQEPDRPFDPVDVLVQVSLDPPGAEGRAGADPRDVGALAERLAGAEGLRLRGVMGVAPHGEDPRPAFRQLAASAAAVCSVDPGATWISAGMSADLEQAIEAGATHVRVGAAVLGPRPRIK